MQMWNLMVVEDEQIVRIGIRHMIDWDQLDVVWKYEASNGEEALQYIKEGNVHIILSDIRMPGMDGLEFAKRVKTENPNIQIIFMSSYDHFEYVKEALRLGALDYLHKPTMNDDEITRAIQNAINRLSSEQVVNKIKINTEERNNILISLLDKYTISDQLPHELEGDEYDECWLAIFRIRDDGAKKADDSSNLLFMSAFSLIEEYVTNTWGGIIFQRNYREIIWIAPMPSKLAEHISDRRKVLELIRVKVFELLNIAIIYSESKIYAGCRKLPDAYMEALLNLPMNEQNDNIIVRKAKEYVDEHLLEDITLSKIAAEIHVSQGYLSRIFMKHLGETFSEYVIRNKMNYAQKMLRFTNKKVYEIAEELGYANSHYFSKLFKEKTGMSPMEYRNK